MKRISVALAVLALAGCSGKDALFERLGNPPPIHDEQQLPSRTELDQAPAPAVDSIPVEAYLIAMRDAYDDQADAAKVGRYVEAGVALSDAYCSRWFRRLDASQRRISFAQNNFNVVRQLGTALIGVARLSSDTTTVYGALNTAIEGVNNNVNEALFLAPDSGVVKQRVFEAMNAQAAHLRGPGGPRRFVTAYVALERYADMCSFVSARQFITQAVDAAQATADPKTGEIRLVTNFQARHASEVETLQDSVDALDDAKAIALAAQPPVASPIPGFGSNIDKTTPSGARAYLKRLLTLTSANAEELGTWQEALGR